MNIVSQKSRSSRYFKEHEGGSSATDIACELGNKKLFLYNISPLAPN